MLVRAFNNSYAYDTMSVERKEKLIDLVKSYPVIWKQSRKAPGLKQKVWDEIGGELGTTGYDARRQWEILRDQMRRENKRLQQDRYYISKWMFYTKMLFTMRHIDGTISACSDDGEHSQPHNQIKPDSHRYILPKTGEEQLKIQVRRDLQESHDDGFNHPPSVDEYSPSALTAAAATAAAATAATATTASMVQASIVEDYCPSTSAGVSSSTQFPRYNEDVELSETRQSRNKRYPDGYTEDEEDYYFAMSLVPSLRCIPRSKKLRVRSKILDLIAAALEDEFEEEDCKVNIELEEKIIPDQIVKTSMENMD